MIHRDLYSLPEYKRDPPEFGRSIDEVGAEYLFIFTPGWTPENSPKPAQSELAWNKKMEPRTR